MRTSSNNASSWWQTFIVFLSALSDVIARGFDNAIHLWTGGAVFSWRRASKPGGGDNSAFIRSAGRGRYRAMFFLKKGKLRRKYGDIIS